jgi:hypothetical protein
MIATVPNADFPRFHTVVHFCDVDSDLAFWVGGIRLNVKAGNLNVSYHGKYFLQMLRKMKPPPMRELHQLHRQLLKTIKHNNIINASEQS